MSQTKDSTIAQSSGNAVEAMRIDQLRQDICSSLAELAEKIAVGSRAQAFSAMVNVAMDADIHVLQASRANPDLAKAMASALTHWPTLHSVFPGESEMLHKHIKQLGLGSAVSFTIKKWRLTAPGTRWAFAYWQLVQESKAFHKLYGFFPSDENGWVFLFDGLRLRRDAEEAIALPELNRTAAAQKAWGAAYLLHLERHFPGNEVLEHPDWKKYFAKTKLESVGKMKSKVLEMIAKGFRVIAPQT
jgi:hypothetical protein